MDDVAHDDWLMRGDSGINSHGTRENGSEEYRERENGCQQKKKEVKEEG